MKYRNAANVLPADLLEKVRGYHEGLLYVPSNRNEQRDREISAMRQKGMTLTQIARRMHLSRRRIIQILNHTGE